MSSEVIETEVIETEVIDDVSDDASEPEVSDIDPDVWDQVLSQDTEVATKVWVCTYSFPVNVDNEGNDLPDGEVARAGETFAAISKSNALTRLFNVIMSVDESVTGFELDIDEEKEDWQINVVKQFFTRDNVNLSLTLVDVI
jgi:hypothetical protein